MADARRSRVPVPEKRRGVFWWNALARAPFAMLSVLKKFRPVFLVLDLLLILLSLKGGEFLRTHVALGMPIDQATSSLLSSWLYLGVVL